MANPVGRPTDYNKSKLDIAINYLENFSSMGDIVPSILGLADELDVRASRVNEWGDKNPEFQVTLDCILSKQGRMLLSGGLTSTLNSNITKLMLHNHGYSDKSEVEQHNTGEAMVKVVYE